jgi:hypothetical protein
MAKFSDYACSSEVTDIMVKLITKFPSVFTGMDVNLVACVHTNNKASKKKPLSLRAVKYPYDVWLNKVYVIEVAQETWAEMNDKQKNLATFHIMCGIPEGAFDVTSKNYAGKKKPDHEVYDQEFAVTGGVLNWMDEENEAIDPLDGDRSVKKSATGRKPVTAEAVATA